VSHKDYHRPFNELGVEQLDEISDEMVFAGGCTTGKAVKSGQQSVIGF